MENKIIFQNEYFSIRENGSARLIIEDLTENNGEIHVECMVAGLGISTDIFRNTMNISSKNLTPVVLVKGKR